MVRNADLLNTFLYRFLILTNIFFSDNTEMPDAMDVVFQTALEYGKSGAVSSLYGFFDGFCGNI